MAKLAAPLVAAAVAFGCGTTKGSLAQKNLVEGLRGAVDAQVRPVCVNPDRSLTMIDQGVSTYKFSRLPTPVLGRTGPFDSSDQQLVRVEELSAGFSRVVVTKNRFPNQPVRYDVILPNCPGSS